MQFAKPKTDTQDSSKIPNEKGYAFAKSIVHNFDTALDIGAHIGTMAVKMAKDFQHLVCFEPCFHSYLIENTKNFNNVIVYPVGLGNEDKTEELFVMANKTGGSSIIEHPRRTWQQNAKKETIQIRKLDNYIFNTIDFIKIDVESYEYFVIDGARKTLQEHSPVIMIEYLKKYQHPTHTSAMTHEILTSLGYNQIKQIEQDYFYIKESK